MTQHDIITQFVGTIYEEGYGLVAKKIMRKNDLSIDAKALYSYLCSYAGSDGRAFPGREKICFELQISKDTFNKYKNELLKKGYLKIEKVRNSKKQFDHNNYIIELCPEKPCPKKPDTEKPDTEISDTTSNSITSNSITNTTATEKKGEPVDNSNYITFFSNNIHMVTPFEAETLNSYVDDGMEPGVITMALQEAVNRDKKNMGYIRAILNRWLEHGLKTIQAVKIDKQNFKNERKKSPHAYKLKSKDSTSGYVDSCNKRGYDMNDLEKKLLKWEDKYK